MINYEWVEDTEHKLNNLWRRYRTRLSTRKIKRINLCFVKSKTKKKHAETSEKQNEMNGINFEAQNIWCTVWSFHNSFGWEDEAAKSAGKNSDFDIIIRASCRSFDFNKLFCYDCALDLCVSGKGECAIFWRFFSPSLNRIFIAMNQSSMAALTTSCILITFDGQVANQPEPNGASEQE